MKGPNEFQVVDTTTTGEIIYEFDDEDDAQTKAAELNDNPQVNWNHVRSHRAARDLKKLESIIGSQATLEKSNFGTYLKFRDAKIHLSPDGTWMLS